MMARLLLLILLLTPGTAAAVDDALAPFLGVYVGTAGVYDVSEEGGEPRLLEIRDMDIEITPGMREGVTITWINVSRVDGRRDVPGVQRRVQRLSLVPSPRAGVYVENTRESLFSTRQDIDVISGDALRWARVREGVMDMFSFGLLPNGRYVLHTYRRTLTEEGMNIVFRSIIDGRPSVAINGHTVRTE